MAEIGEDRRGRGRLFEKSLPLPLSPHSRQKHGNGGTSLNCSMPLGAGLAPPEKTNGSTKALPYRYGGNLHQAVGTDIIKLKNTLSFQCFLKGRGARGGGELFFKKALLPLVHTLANIFCFESYFSSFGSILPSAASKSLIACLMRNNICPFAERP